MSAFALMTQINGAAIGVHLAPELDALTKWRALEGLRLAADKVSGSVNEFNRERAYEMTDGIAAKAKEWRAQVPPAAITGAVNAGIDHGPSDERLAELILIHS